jgi:carboxymethylenebutenolidase
MEKGEPIIDSKIIDLYDAYLDRSLDRRTFLSKLAVLAGGTAAFALLPLLEKNYARADIIAKDDPRLLTEYVHYPG